MPPERRLRVPPDLAKFISHLPPAIKQKVRRGLEEILEDPAEGKPLRAELAGLWSLKIGRFRIIYRPQGSFIEVVAVGPRGVIYQEIGRSLR